MRGKTNKAKKVAPINPPIITIALAAGIAAHGEGAALNGHGGTVHGIDADVIAAIAAVIITGRMRERTPSFVASSKGEPSFRFALMSEIIITPF